MFNLWQPLTFSRLESLLNTMNTLNQSCFHPNLQIIEPLPYYHLAYENYSNITIDFKRTQCPLELFAYWH